MGLRVPEHYQCRNYDSHPYSVSSFSTSLQLICQSCFGRAKLQETSGRVRLGRSWHRKKCYYRKKTDVRNFDNAKVERAKAAARDIHQERAQLSSDSDQQKQSFFWVKDVNISFITCTDQSED